ncbi:hypothetical protein [uncultured Fusobacterium sp.]|uniref:hypothetical protein n=1 Tax=uncultured Fusobacterium sp. TaxID=159267 RepID=UPI0025EB8283|nr:hypothetical protein [uncultured Fusobacterium sp.]
MKALNVNNILQFVLLCLDYLLGNLHSFLVTHSINSNGFTGNIYEFGSFYLINLSSQKAFKNEVVVIEHGLNLNFPVGINFIGLPPITGGSSFTQNVKIGRNTIEILVSSTGLNPSIFFNAFVPKLYD